jgi:polyhydroxyalkanoate synthesis regulator phasin
LRSKRSSTARASTTRSTRASGGARSTAKRKAAAKRGGQARGRQQTARKRSRQTASRATRPAARAASGSDVAGKAVADFRDALARGMVRPANLVILSRARIEEVMSDAVDRGRVTADDARSLAQSLYRRGRKETNDVVKDLEQLVGRGRSGVESRTDTARKRGESAADRARRQVEDATSGVRSRAGKAADPAIAQVDRARRAAGVGPSFPILGYDDLTAAQVQSRLTDLTPAELRKVRDYEKRTANRKSVLSSIATKLG